MTDPTAEEGQVGERLAMSSQVSNVHNDAMTNLAFIKKQQWAMTNYVALLYGAIIAVSATSSGQKVPPGIFDLLVVGTAAYGMYLLYSMQKGMQKFRRRLAAINAAYFTAEELSRWELYARPKPIHHDWHIFAGLTGVILMGAGLALLVLPT